MILIGGGVAVIAVIGFLAMNIMSPKPMQNEAITPAQTGQDTTMTEPETMETQPGSIVDIAVANGSFTTLVQAATEAGLVETLSGPGPFTVFAPTDEAFAKLPPGTVEGLLKDKDALTKVLTYHVVPGAVMAADVVNLTSATTVQGQPVSIEAQQGTVKINDATVVQADIKASNGVIHVIDTVLLPE